MHLYVYIYGELLLNQNMMSERGIGMAKSIFGFVLIAFWKRALLHMCSRTNTHSYTYMHIYVYIYIIRVQGDCARSSYRV